MRGWDASLETDFFAFIDFWSDLGPSDHQRLEMLAFDQSHGSRSPGLPVVVFSFASDVAGTEIGHGEHTTRKADHHERHRSSIVVQSQSHRTPEADWNLGKLPFVPGRITRLVFHAFHDLDRCAYLLRSPQTLPVVRETRFEWIQLLLSLAQSSVEFSRLSFDQASES